VKNPSGKLPVTFPKIGQGFMDWVRTDASVCPGVKNAAGQPEVQYKEGLNIGYRWYDAKGVTPAAFSFGHGLSYTTFSISKLEATPKKTDGRKPIKVQFFVENTGSRYGAESSAGLSRLPTSLGEPQKRLVAFEKVWLNRGEKRKIQISIDPSATNHPLGYWDCSAQKWLIAEGEYQIYVGSSASSIVLQDSITAYAAGPLSLTATAPAASRQQS
jgi:beta-glucosidase